MAVKTPALAGNTTTTVGTSAYALGGALPAPFRSLATVLSNGDQFYYCCRDNVNFEEGVGTISGLPSSPVVTRTTVISSSNSNVAVNWSSGTRNLFADFPSSGLMAAANNLSEITSQATAQASLGLGTAATATLGTGANQVPQITGAGKYPAIDGTPFAAATAILFYQDAAPTGFTRVTTITDKILKVTKGSGSGDTTGGTSDNGTGGWDNSWGITVAGHTLAASEIGGTQSVGSGAGPTTYFATGSSNPHTHAISSSTQWRPPAAYPIIATKN